MADPGTFINIAFPFRQSNRGDFVKLNASDKQAIKADLMHLVLTRKGERLYLPDFGTDLLRYIFEQNDSATHNEIKIHLNDVIKRYLPNLQVNEVDVQISENNEYRAIVRIDYTVTDGVFADTDFIIIEI
jgi:phage baseplate assembly protein W